MIKIIYGENGAGKTRYFKNKEKEGVKVLDNNIMNLEYKENTFSDFNSIKKINDENIEKLNKQLFSNNSSLIGIYPNLNINVLNKFVQLESFNNIKKWSNDFNDFDESLKKWKINSILNLYIFLKENNKEINTLNQTLIEKSIFINMINKTKNDFDDNNLKQVIQETNDLKDSLKKEFNTIIFKKLLLLKLDDLEVLKQNQIN